VDHHLVDEGDLVRARLPPLHRLRLGLHLRIGRRDAYDLPGRDPVARPRPLPVDAKLAGAGPARDEIEACLGHVALEPAVEPDPVIFGGDGELADQLARGRVGHAAAPAGDERTAGITRERFCIAGM
jgi:hypothetical protein